MEESTHVYQYLFLTECNQNILSRSDSSFQHDHGKISKISLLHSNMTMERWINNDKDYSLLVSLCYITYLELYQKTCLIKFFVYSRGHEGYVPSQSLSRKKIR